MYILRDTSQKIAKNPDKEAALEAKFSHLSSGTEVPNAVSPLAVRVPI